MVATSSQEGTVTEETLDMEADLQPSLGPSKVKVEQLVPEIGSALPAATTTSHGAPLASSVTYNVLQTPTLSIETRMAQGLEGPVKVSEEAVAAVAGTTPMIGSVLSVASGTSHGERLVMIASSPNLWECKAQSEIVASMRCAVTAPMHLTRAVSSGNALNMAETLHCTSKNT
jgi:hypothetical protein